MIRNKEELGRMHKEKCKELKKVRAEIAKELGVELHQRECTYEGYCSGTCPKCKQEENLLNAAIRKRRAAAVCMTVLATSFLSGCQTIDGAYELEGDVQCLPEYEMTYEIPETHLKETVSTIESEEWEGGIEEIDEFVIDELEGDVACEWEIAGEVPIEESTAEETEEAVQERVSEEAE